MWNLITCWPSIDKTRKISFTEFKFKCHKYVVVFAIAKRRYRQNNKFSLILVGWKWGWLKVNESKHLTLPFPNVYSTDSRPSSPFWVLASLKWCFHYFPFPSSQIVFYLISPIRDMFKLSRHKIFTGWCCRSVAHPLTRRTRLSLFVWVITFDLSGNEGPDSSYTTAGVAQTIL